MAPAKAKSTTNTAAVNRLVDVISNLKAEITEMKDDIRSCHNIISAQQKLLTYQNDSIQALLRIVTNKTFHPTLHGPQHFSLNESGPQGIVFLGDEQEQFHSAGGRSMTSSQGPARQSPTPRPRRRVVTSTNNHQSPTANNSQQNQNQHVSAPGAATLPGSGGSTTPPRPEPEVSPCGSSPAGLRAAAPRVVSLHIFNLSEDTTVEDVIRHVQNQMDIPSPVCEQLVVTRGSYTSFRLDVPAGKQNVARNTKNWPEGVSIRSFNVLQPKNSAAKRPTIKQK